MLNFQFLELGRDFRPAPVKQEPFSLGAAAVMGGASLLGSLLGFGSQSSTNSQQAALMREQMDFQREENEKQRHENQLNRDWSEMMWNKENEYNTPSAMMARYKEAGLNPFLVGSDTGIGAAGSPTSPSMNGLVGQGSVPSLHAPLMDLNSPVQTILQASAIDANNANQRSMAAKEAVSAIADAYYKLGAPFAYKMADALLPSLGKEVDPATSNLMLDALEARRGLKIQNDARELAFTLQGKYSEQEILSNLQEQNYRISEIVGRLNSMRISNDATIQKMANETLVAAAEAWNLRKVGEYYVANRETIDAIRDSVLEQARSAAIIEQNRSDVSSFETGLILDPDNREKRASAFGIDLDIKSSRVHQYLKELEGSLGQIIHVGVGTGYYTHDGNYVHDSKMHGSKTAKWRTSDRGHVVDWMQTVYE